MIYILIPTTKERRYRLEKTVKSILESETNFPFSIMTYENNDGGWGIALSKMIHNIHGIVFCFSDDSSVEKDTIQKLYDAYIQNFPNNDGICQPWEKYMKGEKVTTPFAHTDVLREILNAGYINYANFEMDYLSKKNGKFLSVPEAKIHHDHYYSDKNLYDDTYKIGQSSLEKDIELLYKRTGFNMLK